MKIAIIRTDSHDIYNYVFYKYSQLLKLRLASRQKLECQQINLS